MNEATLKQALINRLSDRSKDSLTIVEELPIAKGKVRADLVKLTSNIQCFEIKSQYDNLTRLEHQAWHYNRTFRKVTLVAASKHITSKLLKIPDWWGIIEANENGKLTHMRKAKNNPNQSKLALLDILNKAELQSIIRDSNISEIPLTSTATEIKGFLSDRYNITQISSMITFRLKKRQF